MKKFKVIIICLLPAILCCNNCSEDRHKSNESIYPDKMYEYSDNISPRWSSFENINGEKGRGGMENNGAKGHAFDMIKSGQRCVLLDTRGPGIINRIWITIRNRSPYTLRGLVINMYWDNEEKPAVSVPFGDFFGVGLGKTAIYENALFSNPEGRSFNSCIQMPFEKSARIEIVNEMDYDLFLIFFDVDYQLLKRWDDNFMYFHAFWNRNTATTPGDDFKILPEIKGKGRFLGTNISVITNPEYKDYWWGEGELKAYLDGDDEYPTLVGTGTEDYIGSAWGQGQFCNKYNGCLIADAKNRQWSFYRYHVIDPVYFHSACKITMQQMGGTSKKNVIAMQKEGVNLIPVTISGDEAGLIHIYRKDSVVDLESTELPGDDAWTNFFRSDDVSAVAYFYLDIPKNDLPEIQDINIRTWNLKRDTTW